MTSLVVLSAKATSPFFFKKKELSKISSPSDPPLGNEDRLKNRMQGEEKQPHLPLQKGSLSKIVPSTLLKKWQFEKTGDSMRSHIKKALSTNLTKMLSVNEYYECVQ